jgi:7,8-dihydropterin-6-yl-methyl-4-(beta-D-ribofuranosyl)aminobenzene 5'-phosphate synthase
MSTSNQQPSEFKVKEADSVEILSLVDNSVDFLSATNNPQVHSFRRWKRERDGKEWGATHMDLPFAEHGFSVLIRVFSGDESRCVLFDTGGSQKGMVENAERMGISLSEVESVIISHGHYDHFGGLAATVKAVGKADLPVIVHDNMFRTRGSANAKGSVRQYPDFPSEEQLSPARLVSTKQPSLTAGGMICVTGEIPRRTRFETGYTQHKTFASGAWKSDPLIMDERAVAIHVKGKGLVVISGCAHAGIINTVNYAQQITGTKQVHAVIGGFHLAGKTFENRIQPTIEELQKINPRLIVPSHCTGWKAMCTMAKAFPEAFVWNSVGNLYKI